MPLYDGRAAVLRHPIPMQQSLVLGEIWRTYADAAKHVFRAWNKERIYILFVFLQLDVVRYQYLH